MANETTRFRFNGLSAGECFADLACDVTGLEISPVQCLGTGAETEIQITSTGQAEGWSVYLRLVTGEVRVLHDARTMIGASRALVAADWGYGFPASLEAWDMCCAADSVRDLPEALRREMRRTVPYLRRTGHAGRALAAWIDLAQCRAALRNG